MVNAKCTNCGAEIEVDERSEAGVCPYCKAAYITEKAIKNINNTTNNNAQVINNYYNVESQDDEGKNSGKHCPKCNSRKCRIISEISTDGKDFSAGKGCLGALLLGPLGLLCGACGKGKQTKTQNYWLCENCGNKWKV